MDEDQTDNTKYTKKVGDFDIESIDPIQDIMSKEELEEAHNRISALLDAEEKDSKD